MQKYRMTLSYDGTDFGGWQMQPNVATIQEALMRAFEKILKKKISIIGSGRTDAGVHAFGQVAHFSLKEPIKKSLNLRSALNGCLPPSIRVKEISPTAASFHARFSSKKKHYHYYLHTHPVHSPFRQLYSTHLRPPFDIRRLKEATPLFCGTHDFTSFANVDPSSLNPIKTLFDIRIIQELESIRLEFEGSGFLYKMVRNIVGTLLEIGNGKRSYRSISELFAKKDRRYAPAPAPAKGLFLAKVDY